MANILPELMGVRICLTAAISHGSVGLWTQSWRWPGKADSRDGYGGMGGVGVTGRWEQVPTQPKVFQQRREALRHKEGRQEKEEAGRGREELCKFFRVSKQPSSSSCWKWLKCKCIKPISQMLCPFPRSSWGGWLLYWQEPPTPSSRGVPPSRSAGTPPHREAIVPAPRCSAQPLSPRGLLLSVDHVLSLFTFLSTC